MNSQPDTLPTLIISCHSDTGFRFHRLKEMGDAYFGHLDNFVGVHSVMSAYFSGRMDFPRVRIELTYGEETGMDGALEVLESLSPRDIVVVVDVTGTPTKKDIVIEKCQYPGMQDFVREALDGLSYDLYADCPDPISQYDECDVYRARTANVFFLGIPCTGGDYNRRRVRCQKKSVGAVAEALIRLASTFHRRSSGVQEK